MMARAYWGMPKIFGWSLPIAFDALCSAPDHHHPPELMSEMLDDVEIRGPRLLVEGEIGSFEGVCFTDSSRLNRPYRGYGGGVKKSIARG